MTLIIELYILLRLVSSIKNITLFESRNLPGIIQYMPLVDFIDKVYYGRNCSILVRNSSEFFVRTTIL